MRRSLLVIVCCALALAAQPAAASAKPGYYVNKASRFVLLHLSGSNGYRVHVLGSNTSSVSIMVSKGNVTATYSVRGRVTDERIEGRFGGRGRVSLRLLPKGSPEEQANEPGCKGKDPFTQRGRFQGTIRFRGEGGFTEVRATQARGSVFRSFRQVCKRRDSGNRRKIPWPPAVSLGAASSRGPRAPWFSVFKEEPAYEKDQSFFPSFDEAIYTATSSERRGGIDIYRGASVTAPPETFEVNPPGERPRATVDPPAPFSGTATYERGPAGEALWSGDLRVELPGLGEVPLADSSYRAKLCRSFVCACPVGKCAFVIVSSGGWRATRLRRLSTAAAPTPSPWRWPGSLR
jgi:hypothetical protein